IQGREFRRGDHRLHIVRQDVSEEPPCPFRAVLDRKRAVFAEGISRVDCLAEAVGLRLSRQREGSRCAAQHREQPVRASRQRCIAPDSRRPDREVSAVRSSSESAPASRDPLTRTRRRTPNKRSFAARLIAWQRAHGRHDLPWQRTRDAYRIWLSEIMLQQTQVATVIPYYERFVASFPDVNALAEASLDRVLEHWSGLGYYRRAHHLHAAAKAIVEHHGGEFPRDAQAIATLPGIGRSTAAAIAAFAFGARGAILDGNVRRLLARHRGIAGYPGDKPLAPPPSTQPHAPLPHPPPT